MRTSRTRTPVSSPGIQHQSLATPKSGVRPRPGSARSDDKSSAAMAMAKRTLKAANELSKPRGIFFGLLLGESAKTRSVWVAVKSDVARYQQTLETLFEQVAAAAGAGDDGDDHEEGVPVPLTDIAVPCTADSNVTCYAGARAQRQLVRHTSNVRSALKVLILDAQHQMYAKNKDGMERMLRYLGWSFSYGTAADVPGHDVVWSPLVPLPIEKYPGVKFIMGPQFSNVPDHRVLNVNNANHNGVYIQPSGWVVRLWRSRFKPMPHITLPLAPLPFPVDTDKFAPSSSVTSRNLVVVYFKYRATRDLEAVRAALRKETVKEFSYFKI